jgi:Protein of unknown function (DUF1501)
VRYAAVTSCTLVRCRHSALGLTQFAGLKSLGTVGAPRSDASCIFLVLTGGPSQLDTWDMKPDAPPEIRGPYRPIKTNVPGMEISEIFPRTAKIADKFAIIRSMYHNGAADHQTGLQMIRTGRLAADGVKHPNLGQTVTKLREVRGDILSGLLLPADSGIQRPEALNLEHEALGVREKYGSHRFGRDCLRARRLIESGSRFVTVNMFDTVFNETT